MTQYYTIRRSFLIPLGLLLLETLALMGVGIMNEQPVAKLLILGVMIVPIFILFVESASRRAVVDDEQVTVLKFLRRKTLTFSEITSVETVLVRKRAFLTLCAGEEFIIISNAYTRFPELVNNLLEKVSPDVVSEETRQMAESPPVKSTDVFSCWLGVLLMAFILHIQLRGGL